MACSPSGFCYYLEEVTYLLYHYHGVITKHYSIGPLRNVELIKIAGNCLNIA